ncbi:MAG: glycosyltransferase family 87 protein, partial [Ktedonobacterales bacterium]
MKRYLLALVALACAAVFAYWGVWLPLHSTSYDFTGPYEAAYALAHHATLQVYDVTAQRAYSAATLHLPDGPSDFRWTPPMAALLIPLGLLPYAVARIIWWALGLVTLAASLWLLARCVAAVSARAGRERAGVWRAFAILLCAAAVMQPVTDSLRLGQSTPLLLLGFALMAYGEVFDLQALGGLGLAIAILDKLFPAALLLYFLWRGRYRVGAAALGVVALVCAVTLPLTGLGMYGAFGQALLAFSKEPNGGAVNLSLYHALVVGASALLRPGQPEPRGGPLVALAALVCV